MARAKSFSTYVKRATVSLVCMGLGGYFAYHAVEGDHGFIAWIKLERKQVELAEQLQHVRGQRRDLEHRITLMRPESLDPDMLDERARESLNLAHPNDITIFRNAR